MKFPATYTRTQGTVTVYAYGRVLWGRIPATYAEISGSLAAYLSDDTEVLQQQTLPDGRMAIWYTNTNPELKAAAYRLAELDGWISEVQR
ncbi:MAG TPA: hypothetical protein VFT66_15515 [Roseiflexaceae bacterium]|nr:hypothetical protein [Roseiflexaceae bacterium]